MNEKVYFIENRRIINLFFDISLLLYLIAYYIFYQDINSYAANIRTLATITIAICGTLMCISYLRTIDYYLITYIIFFIFGFVSLLWAKEGDLVISIFPSIIRTIIILIFLSVRIRTYDDIERIMIIHIITVVLLDFFIMNLMIDYYSLTDFFLKRFGDNFNYNSNATALLNSISFLFCLYFVTKVKKKWKIFILMTFFTFIIIICESKQGMISLILGFLLYIYISGNLKKKFKTGVASIILLFIIWELMMNVPELYKIIGYRFKSALGLISQNSYVDVSTVNRNNLLHQAVETWLMHPLIGTGMNNFPAIQTVKFGYYYAHNNYLELLADLGLVGFLIYYSNYLRICLIIINKKNKMQVVLKAIFYMMLFVDFTVVTFQDLRYQLVLYMIFLGLGKVTQYERNNNGENI